MRDEEPELNCLTGRVFTLLRLVLVLGKCCCCCCEETEFREKVEAVGLGWARAYKGGTLMF